jgi:hypothetical protein
MRTRFSVPRCPISAESVLSAGDNKGGSPVFNLQASYGLDGPGTESRCGRDFRIRLALGPTQPLKNRYRISFPGLERPGLVVNRPPHLVPKLKKE